MNDKIKENLLDQSCAPTDNLQSNWDRIDWTKAEQAVKKLQARIVKAQKEGRHNKVKALQWTLTHSFYAKALAVKRVTSNGGSCTPGVDKEIWDTPKAKTQAITQLKRRGYQPMPLRRVHIKKSNGKLRPLGIPTMKDRAMQALYLMALEPVSETTADTRSYGFRKERCCMDAVQQCHNILRKGYSPEWILEGDIKGCFDHISHEWLLANIPMDKAILRKWLKCGYVFNKQMFPTEEGTPQGGIISPTLANMTLDGLQKALADRYKRHHVNGKLYSPMVNLVRYADDFIITCENKETLENYKAVVLNAIGEVENALSEINNLRVEYKKRIDVTNASLKVQELTIRQYELGFVDYFSVSDAQRQALIDEREQIALRGSRFRACVNLIAAIGGGWQLNDEEQREALEPKLEDNLLVYPQ